MKKHYCAILALTLGLIGLAGIASAETSIDTTTSGGDTLVLGSTLTQQTDETGATLTAALQVETTAYLHDLTCETLASTTTLPVAAETSSDLTGDHLILGIDGTLTLATTKTDGEQFGICGECHAAKTDTKSFGKVSTIGAKLGSSVLAATPWSKTDGAIFAKIDEPVEHLVGIS